MGAYFGSKATSGLCQAIIALMPPHDTYIESHLGGGAIMKRKPPALRNIGIDLNEGKRAAEARGFPSVVGPSCATVGELLAAHRARSA
jgi:DNA adenine methylase